MQSKRRIGSVDVCNGLYHLNMREFEINRMHFSFAATCNKEDLWHYRLGHPSSNRITTLNKMFPDISISTDFVCEICPKSKQKKISFCDSTSISLNAFDLIHVHIWGPNSLSLDGYRYFVTIVYDCTSFT